MDKDWEIIYNRRRYMWEEVEALGGLGSSKTDNKYWSYSKGRVFN